MLFIVGLGNPGPKYAHTRHNAGYQVLDQLGEIWVQKYRQLEGQSSTNFNWRHSTSTKLEYAWVTSNGQKIELIKPTGYMNTSGQPVRTALQKHTDWLKQSPVDLANLIVVYDDLDLELGSYKRVFGKGPKVHNGLNSVVTHLGTDQFWHVRIGIDNRGGDRSIPGHHYVLQPFIGPEQELATAAFKQVATELWEWIYAEF